MWDGKCCYKVTVRTTNALRDMTCDYWGNDVKIKCNYYDCVDGVLYVVTDDIKKIIDKFGNDTIINIKNLGIGYFFKEGD